MTGSLTTKKLKDGEYIYVVLSYKDHSGQWKTKWVSTKLPMKGNKKKAKSMIPQIIEQYRYLELPANAASGISRDITVCDYLDLWLEIKKGETKKSTYEGYAYRVKRIKEYFSASETRLIEVRPRTLDTFYKYALSHGKKNKKTGACEPMKPRSVRSYKSILHAVFAQAQIDGLVQANPAVDVKVRGKSNRQCAEEYLFLTESEISELLHFLSNGELFQRLVPIAFVAAYYGLRRSEILGLRWDSVDLKKKLLHIRRTVVRIKSFDISEQTKTVDGTRSLNLFPTAISCFEKIRAEQEDYKAYFGAEYKNSDGYIFTWEDGRMYNPDYISTLFSKATARFGRPEISLHKLRHSCCSLLFEKGWDIKKVQYWMGHKDAGTTINIYAHFNRARLNGSENDLSEISKAAADLFEETPPDPAGKSGKILS